MVTGSTISREPVSGSRSWWRVETGQRTQATAGGTLCAPNDGRYGSGGVCDVCVRVLDAAGRQAAEDLESHDDGVHGSSRGGSARERSAAAARTAVDRIRARFVELD